MLILFEETGQEFLLLSKEIPYQCPDRRPDRCTQKCQSEKHLCIHISRSCRQRNQWSRTGEESREEDSVFVMFAKYIVEIVELLDRVEEILPILLDESSNPMSREDFPDIKIWYRPEGTPDRTDEDHQDDMHLADRCEIATQWHDHLTRDRRDDVFEKSRQEQTRISDRLHEIY